MSNAAFGRVAAKASVQRAKEAVRNWELAVEKAKAEGTQEDVEFCERSLRACEARLPGVKEAASRWWEW